MINIKNLFIGCLLMACGVMFGSGIVAAAKYGYDHSQTAQKSIDTFGCFLMEDQHVSCK